MIGDRELHTERTTPESYELQSCCGDVRRRVQPCGDGGVLPRAVS